MSIIQDWISLSLVPGLGDVSVRHLVNYFGSAANVLQANRSDLVKGAGLRVELADRLLSRQLVLDRGEEELRKLQRFGGAAVCLADEQYPEILKQTARPPSVLYTVGNKDILQNCAVAIVGSRAATEYGRRTAFSLARELAKQSISVVSGLALGIDAQAHSGCLSVSGSTIAVLGCGLDVIYPPRNRGLYDKIKTDGLIVSEYPLNTRPEGFRFPARNRIIAGLSKGVVIVEAAKKSGSLITASLALEEGREIFAVPGRIDSSKSAGTHWLLQQGAKLIQGVDDILEELGWHCLVNPESADPEKRKIQAVPDPGSEECALLNKMDAYPVKRDELICRASLPAARVNELLLLLELGGLVETLPGGEIRKIIEL